VVVTVGVPAGSAAMTNSIRVETCIRLER
jgi:hypothetical protein